MRWLRMLYLILVDQGARFPPPPCCPSMVCLSLIRVAFWGDVHLQCPLLESLTLTHMQAGIRWSLIAYKKVWSQQLSLSTNACWRGNVVELVDMGVWGKVQGKMQYPAIVGMDLLCGWVHLMLRPSAFDGLVLIIFWFCSFVEHPTVAFSATLN